MPTHEQYYRTHAHPKPMGMGMGTQSRALLLMQPREPHFSKYCGNKLLKFKVGFGLVLRKRSERRLPEEFPPIHMSELNVS